MPHRELELNANEQTMPNKFLPNSVELEFKRWLKNTTESAVDERSEELLKKKNTVRESGEYFFLLKRLCFLKAM